MMQKTYHQEQHQQQQHRLRNLSREEAINRCLKSLIHALQCKKGSDCSEAGCGRMKRIVEHTKKCHLLQSQTTPRDARCAICSQLMQLCIFHTKLCRNPCDAPFCRVMKRKLSEQSLDASAPSHQRWVFHDKLWNWHWCKMMKFSYLFSFRLRTSVHEIVTSSSNGNDDSNAKEPKRMRLNEVPQQSSSNTINFETLEHAHRQQMVVEWNDHDENLNWKKNLLPNR